MCRGLGVGGMRDGIGWGGSGGVSRGGRGEGFWTCCDEGEMGFCLLCSWVGMVVERDWDIRIA